MTGATTACEARLIALLAEAARGPERDGLFALWLVLRAAEGLLPPTPVSSRNHRRRLQALQSRLAPAPRARDAGGRRAGALAARGARPGGAGAGSGRGCRRCGAVGPLTFIVP